MAYYSDLDKKRFSFESRAIGVDESTFAVVNFKGFEGVSKTYEFDILLVSDAAELDLEEILQSSAVLKIHRDEADEVLFNGILADFEQLNEFNNHVYYRAKLVPKFWWLTLTTHNQVFLNDSVPKLIEYALLDSELEPQDFDMQTLSESDYPQRDYVCQYSESHFQFVSRWLEREGIYYYFDQEDGGEKIIFSDDCTTDEPLFSGADLYYQPASGLESTHLNEVIYSFTCRQKQLPKRVILKDYDYENPSLDVIGEAEVDSRGRGTQYVYGHYFKTPEEGERLAEIFSEQMLSEKQSFYGESMVPYMMPGFTFSLKNHYRKDYNQDYFIVEVTHEGSQTGCLSPEVVAGISEFISGESDTVTYRNHFKAIPASTQFRPEKLTERPHISGTLHAKIDAEGEGQYAEIDDYGRYKVRMPFDVNDEHMDGRASIFIRMAQPYAGTNRGMQFPLTKGTEVILSFIDGHPDRPMITGAVNNHETPGPVNADNRSESVIQTGGANKIRMEDQSGGERIIMESPKANSWVRIGTPNDPVSLYGSGTVIVKEGDSYTEEGAYVTTNGVTTDITAPTKILADGAEVGSITETAGAVYYLEYIDGTDKAVRTVYFAGDTNAVEDTLAGDGIRIQTSSSLFLEAQSRYADYVIGQPTVGNADSTRSPKQIPDLLALFGVDYNPKGLISYANSDGTTSAWNSDGTENTSSTQTMANALSAAHVQVSSLDTVNTQEGNIYDFGGYWNYNLGNSYAEEWIDQSAELNKKNALNWPNKSLNAETREDLITLSVLLQFMSGCVMVPVACHAGSVGGAAGAGLAAGCIGMLASTIAAAESGEKIQCNIGDVIAGPNSGPIETWHGKVGSSFTDNTSGSSAQDLTSARPNGPMHTSTTWVEKQFGDSYEYHHGNSIDVHVGSTEEHVRGDSYEYRYGGQHEEYKFNGEGTKCVWEKYVKGTKTGMMWDYVTGDLRSYEYINAGHFKFEATFPTYPRLGISLSNSTLDCSLDLSVGSKIAVAASMSLELNVNLSAGFSIEIERKLGGKLEMDEITTEMKFKSFGMEAAKAAALEAQAKNLVLEQVITDLGSKTLELGNSSVELKSGAMTLDSKGFKFF